MHRRVLCATAACARRPLGPTVRAFALAICVLVLANCDTSCGKHTTSAAKLDAAATPDGAAQLDVTRAHYDSDEEVVAALASLRERHALPALAATVFIDGHQVFDVAMGTRRAGHPDEPISKTSRWHLGSCTKAMTATLIGMLVDEGKLRLTDTLDKVFVKDLHPNFNVVTIQDVLRHRGGLPRNFPSDLWQQMHDDAAAGVAPSVTRQRVVRSVLSRRMEKGGSNFFLYSNVGYVVLGVVLELVTGKPWETLVRERIFEPLAMSSCGFGPPAAHDPASPWGHITTSDAVTPDVHGDNPPSLGPAGTVHCTLHDWATFVLEHERGERERGTLLSRETMRLLHQPLPGTDYAGGWSVVERDWAGGTAFTHSGSNGMFRAVVWVAPERHAVMLAATNLGNEASGDALNQTFRPMIERFVRRSN